MIVVGVFFFFKQKTAYEIKECDWSSDVCSSDLQYLSAEKVRRVLGWEPLYTMEDSLKETIDWYLDFFRENQLEREKSD